MCSSVCILRGKPLFLVSCESNSTQNGKNISRKARKGRQENLKLRLAFSFKLKKDIDSRSTLRSLRALRETPFKPHHRPEDTNAVFHAFSERYGRRVMKIPCGAADFVDPETVKRGLNRHFIIKSYKVNPYSTFLSALYFCDTMLEPLSLSSSARTASFLRSCSDALSLTS